MTATATVTPRPAFISTSHGPRETSIAMADVEAAAVQRLATLAMVGNPSIEDKHQVQRDLSLLCAGPSWPQMREQVKRAMGGMLIERRESETGFQAVARHQENIRAYVALLEAEAAGKKTDAKKLVAAAAACGFEKMLATHRAEMAQRHKLTTVDVGALDEARRKAEADLAAFEEQTEQRRRFKLQQAISAAVSAITEASRASQDIAQMENNQLRNLFEFTAKTDYSGVKAETGNEPTRTHGSDQKPACTKCGSAKHVQLAGTQGVHRAGARFGLIAVPPRKITRKRFLCRACNVDQWIERPDLGEAPAPPSKPRAQISFAAGT